MLKLITKAQAAWMTRDRGATAAEYALLITFIAIALIAGATVFGNGLSAMFKTACAKVTGAAC
ncbi:Flp family type IVb pilin [Catellatospora tritici]|uniref:Flp family type IVb pilin n=1 Tax=Catellatospora tritici TaxID=2851566 RepID=UPI001C2DE45C|nr:Flp family type IVb pilin [Catellatospora tritici]MBV1852178.1 Flp family type IVb pilin [Catellatospora tritici]